jgi:hypothetical protein
VWTWGYPGAVTHIDEDGTVTVAREPKRAAGIAPDATGAWVSTWNEPVVRRVEDGRVVRTVDLEEPVGEILLDDQGRLWAAGDERIFVLDL